MKPVISLFSRVPGSSNDKVSSKHMFYVTLGNVTPRTSGSAFRQVQGAKKLGSRPCGIGLEDSSEFELFLARRRKMIWAKAGFVC